MLFALDNGGQFLGKEFQELLHSWAISHACTTARNPSANGVVERMHLTIGNLLRVLLKDHSCQTQQEARELLKRALNAALHAMQSNVSEATNNSPGSIVFGRDMLHNAKIEVDMERINDLR